MADLAGESANPVLLQVNRRGAQSHASVVPNSSVHDLDMAALHTHIPELQA